MILLASKGFVDDGAVDIFLVWKLSEHIARIFGKFNQALAPIIGGPVKPAQHCSESRDRDH